MDCEWLYVINRAAHENRQTHLPFVSARPTGAIADAEKYVFKSVEIKETSFRIDGVFVPLLLGDITYFVEAQFQLDPQFYARFFAEIFLYLKQYAVTEWKAVVIYPSRAMEQKNFDGYEALLESGRVQRVYLDELPDAEKTSNEVGLFKLLVEPEKSAPTVARKLMENATLKQVDLIEQIILYKFSKLTREEIKKMLGLQRELMQDTQVYKEIFNDGKQEGNIAGKLETVPLLRELGLSDEKIAERLKLPIDTVKAVPRRKS
jgi:predicted transposase/invertase (TIGR01784 family)